VVAALELDKPPRYPSFSWDRLPVYFHSENASGPWNAEAVKRIAKYPLVTFEKTMGGGQPIIAETNMPAACKQIRAANSNVTAMYYLNSM
jgi:hypothetical protein